MGKNVLVVLVGVAMVFLSPVKSRKKRFVEIEMPPGMGCNPNDPSNKFRDEEEEFPPAACTHVGQKSINGLTRSTVTFKNLAKSTVKILWLDYKGQEVFYKNLAPGAFYNQPTYVTHPWIARDIATGELLHIESGGNSKCYFTPTAATHTVN